MSLTFPISFARERVLVLGDSHANVFGHWRFRLQLPGVKFKRCVVGGATASGLDNPNSKTQAMVKFAGALESESPSLIITQLGEVDTGFVIWYRAAKYQQPVESMLETAVENYSKLIEAARARAKVLVISAPLPTIRDGEVWGEVANLRREVRVLQADRTALTLEFNRRVQSVVSQLGCEYLSIDSKCMGEDGLVADFLRHHDKLNHHYRPSAYAKLLAQSLVTHFRSSADCRYLREDLACSRVEEAWSGN